MRIKTITLLLLLLLNFILNNCHAQSKSSLGVMVSPDFSYVNASFSKNNGGTRYNTIPGFNIGFSVYKKISNHFFINYGLWYAKKGVKYTVNVAYANTLGHVYFIAPGMKYHRYQDIEIPLLLNYKVGKKKLQYTASIGAIFAFGLRETITTVTEFENTTYNVTSLTKKPERIYLSIGTGILYKFHPQYSLLFEPTYKLDVKAIATSIFPDTHSFGLRTTLIYRFKY